MVRKYQPNTEFDYVKMLCYYLVLKSDNQTTLISVALDLTIILPCSTQSDMKPTWFKSNKEISFSHYEVCTIYCTDHCLYM